MMFSYDDDTLTGERESPMSDTKPKMRTFDTGATRSTDDGKLDYEGFLSPLALRRYAEYMQEHRKQADGKMRDSDNWQKGIPYDAYMKSMMRHRHDLWMMHRGYAVFENGKRLSKQDVICADLFNLMGYLHELEKAGEAILPCNCEDECQNEEVDSCTLDVFCTCDDCSGRIPKVQGGDDLTEAL